MKCFDELSYRKKCLLVGRVTDLYSNKGMNISEIAKTLGESEDLVEETFEHIIRAALRMQGL